MIIQSISNIYNINSFRKIYSETNNKFRVNNYSSGDIVVFGAKKYDADSIVNPTNHCAYCGCKVYTEAQIEALAKEMLSSKADRLRGDIRSILEKLADARNSQEIAVAKRIENEEEIKFFEGLLDVSSKRSYLKGEAIFEQVYGCSKEDAIELLSKNMLPLQKTIDHVSPQNEQKENNSSDVNLVEACYCCNHDLKKGSSFHEFYTMFPSIKNNMPPEKFQYAAADLLDSSQAQVAQRLSTANILKLMKNLFAQRTEATNNLYAVDYRIKSYRTAIQDSIQSCRDEILEKEFEIQDLEQKFEELKKDPEFMALVNRYNLQTQIESTRSAGASFRERMQKLSNAINELRNQNKAKKHPTSMTEEEKNEKIESLKANIAQLSPQVAALDEQEIELEISLENLNNEHPTIEMLQARKSKAESIVSAYNSLHLQNLEIQARTSHRNELQDLENSLITQISELPETAVGFDIQSYTPEEQERFQYYQDLIEAMDFIDKHPNGGSVKALIKNTARVRIAEELSSIEQEGVVVDYNNCEKRKALASQLEKVQKEIVELNTNIEKSLQMRTRYEEITAEMSEEEAIQQIQVLSEKIRELTDKQNQVKIPQTITTLKAEITLLLQTIKDLEAQIAKIDEAYAINA